MQIIIKIYDYLHRHTKVLWSSLVALLILLCCLVFSINFSENINDFLPLNSSERQAMEVYQNVSGANKLFVLFNNPDDADKTVEAIDHFVEQVKQQDVQGWCGDLVFQMDMTKMQEISEYVYDNIPYFLTDADYERMESLLSDHNYVDEQLQRNLELLMFPSGGLMTHNIARDPLALFTPVLSKLQGSNQQMVFEMYDGYIFTPDMSRAVVMISSPFGGSETENNSKLIDLINSAISDTESKYPDVTAHVVGGPDIAVGNASRIKKDSMIAISLSVILIILLAAFTIRSLRNILLIFLSLGWGWLFAMGGIALLGNEVSIIVIGISSVILGIAVNYPLHLISHLSHDGDVRRTLKQIALPLIIGNITTVGAFLTLVPLHAVALRDLGVFASLLLIGTIVFVLVYLPHMAKAKCSITSSNKLFDKVASVSPERSKAMIVIVLVTTIILSFYSTRTEFDANLANCNYMSQQQRDDMKYFNDLLSRNSNSSSCSVYVLASGETYDEALENNGTIVPIIDSLVSSGMVNNYSGVSQFLVSKEEQQHRIDRWNEFTSKHKLILTDELCDKGKKYGFSPQAFSQFISYIQNSSELIPRNIEDFSELSSFVFQQNLTITESDGQCHIVNVLNVDNDKVEYVKGTFNSSFDVTGMNSTLSENLSDNFNYIGLACSIIVFLFLWFSFGRIELAIIAFLPMAISWIWILGLMTLFGIKFNIVNIILATFIFGQGDDYTIFMTEGCQSEYANRRKVLSSYKRSILQSAIIMFIGIGTLIISQHPAMRSLAEVTIIGMMCVVLMAYMIPPMLFKWLTYKNGKCRKHPITIKTILLGYPKDPMEQVQGRYIYKGALIMRTVKENLKDCNNAILVGDYYELDDKGYGEQAIMIALENPKIKVIAHIDDDERRQIAKVAAEDFVNNVEFVK